MIKASCDKGDMEITLNGDLSELYADTLTILNTIYTTLADDNLMCATLYRDLIERSISSAFIYNDNREED